MNFLKHIKQYKINSIFVKNFFAAFCVVLIPIFIINILMFNFYHSKALKENQEFANNELTFVKENVDRIFKWVDSNCDYMVNDIYINSFLQHGIKHSDLHENALIANVVQNQMQRIKLFDPCIESIHLYAINPNLIISTEGAGTPDMFYDQTVKEAISSGTALNDITVFYNQNGRKIIRKQVPFNTFGIDTGVIFVNIDCESLKKYLTENISGANHIVVSKPDGDALFELGEKNKQKYSITNSSEETGIHYSSAYQNTINLFPLMFPLLLISMIFVLFATLFLTYKACRPISSIMDIMENAGSWYNQNHTEPLAGEARYILENYLDRIYYSKEVESDLMERVSDLKKSQIEALNLQIQPHFLYNTLQLISMCAMELTGSENDAVIAIDLLSEIFKYSLNSSEYLGSVKNEITFTEAYVNIQKLKYNGRINVEFNIAEDVLDCKTSKIVIQPLIENSLSHGILPYKESGQILVEAYRQNDRLIIEVIDDGVGISPQSFKEIKEYMKNNNKDGKHIGLSNVDKKIKLMFGDKYGLRIDENYIDGARIIIEQPI